MWISLFFVVLMGMVQARQGDCDDPFEGEQQLFSTDYWTLTDFCKHSVPYREIRSGGPPPDGIPPIDHPKFESIEAAGTWLQPQSPVIALSIGGDARAYPLAVLMWHEIANDVVSDVPVAVTFCPLCNSSIVFDRRVEGETLRFGVSGMLRNSDMVMWDDKTQSWWQQLTGEGIVGTYTGIHLTMISSQVVSFEAFSTHYPDGRVLSRDTGADRHYGLNPYENYESGGPYTHFFNKHERDRRLPATERVLAGLIMGNPVAYPFSILAEERVVNDRVGEMMVIALWQPGVASALDQAQIDESRDVGMAALYDRTLDNGQVLTFYMDDAGNIRDEATDSVWNVFGMAIEGELAGTQLYQFLAAPHFWFAWVAFKPETVVYGLDNE